MAPPCAGVVVVWTRHQPRLLTYRISADGLLIGRGLIRDDPELVERHALLEVVHDRFEIEPEGRIDLGVRRLTAPVSYRADSLPIFLVAGSSVIVLVDDVRPFEHVTPVREGSLVIAGSLGSIARAIDDAARAEEHVSLRGPWSVVEPLALRYAAKLGSHARFRPGGAQHLDHFLSTRPSVRTVILELTRPLFERDIEAIEHLLETDLRFVIVQYDAHFAQWLPQALAADPLEVPAIRFDELPHAFAEHAGRPLEAAIVATLLEHVAEHGEDAWPAALDKALT